MSHLIEISKRLLNSNFMNISYYYYILYETHDTFNNYFNRKLIHSLIPAHIRTTHYEFNRTMLLKALKKLNKTHQKN